MGSHRLPSAKNKSSVRPTKSLAVFDFQRSLNARQLKDFGERQHTGPPQSALACCELASLVVNLRLLVFLGNEIESGDARRLEAMVWNPPTSSPANGMDSRQHLELGRSGIPPHQGLDTNGDPARPVGSWAQRLQMTRVLGTVTKSEDQEQITDRISQDECPRAASGSPRLDLTSSEEFPSLTALTKADTLPRSFKKAAAGYRALSRSEITSPTPTWPGQQQHLPSSSVESYDRTTSSAPPCGENVGEQLLTIPVESTAPLPIRGRPVPKMSPVPFRLSRNPVLDRRVALPITTPASLQLLERVSRELRTSAGTCGSTVERARATRTPENPTPSAWTTSRGECESANRSSSTKKSFNVDSPSFTPAQLQSGSKKHTFSSQTANAAVFTPKGSTNSATPALAQDSESSFVTAAGVRDFTPQAQNYDLNTTSATNGVASDSSAGIYDAFTMATMGQALPTTQYNPYAEDHTSMAGVATPFYQAQGAYAAAIQPLQYHLYAPVGPHKADMHHPYQKQAYDFFLPNDIREDLQKKSAATRQVLPNSQLPDVSQYHSLVPLDTAKSSHTSIFGSSVCWVYKATSKKNGNVYCLRRLQGARVASKNSTNEPLAKWKRISNGNIVTVHEVFTSRDFNDTSLIFIHNYHPNSKTLAEHHISQRRFGQQQPPIQENVLWSYISQLCNALRTVHGEGLAARCIHPTKVIMTEKNRIRLSACMILDVLEYETSRPIAELQQEDLVDLGKLILILGLGTMTISPVQSALEQFQRTMYSPELKELVFWLVTPPYPEQPIQKTITELTPRITHHILDSFDSSLQAYDGINSNLHQELENGRIARLMLKLGVINERPDFDNELNWSETGERYSLKLFRDYVFHQVDSNGNPVLDLGHMLSCLNKLDAGIDEKVYLTSRDHQTSFIISYKELKKQVNNAFNELQKAGQTKSATSRAGY
ncbi:hypothetical protein JX266_002834 [Neoarthrinium moseri]|nr:hypothetical protein JX266_002834 [Neoarthrinium moseri]